MDTRENNSFFGIYDGHRNAYAADYIQKHLRKKIAENAEFYEDREQAIKEGKFDIQKMLYFNIFCPGFLNIRCIFFPCLLNSLIF